MLALLVAVWWALYLWVGGPADLVAVGPFQSREECMQLDWRPRELLFVGCVRELPISGPVAR